MVTHDLEYLRYAKTAVRIFNGTVLDTYNEKNKDQLLVDVKSKRGKANTEGAEKVSFIKKALPKPTA
jgi:hypothetical protein